MNLILNDEEAVRLAQRLSELTGEPVEDAVAQALRDRLETLKLAMNREERSQRVLALIADMQARMPASFKDADSDRELYDDLGLPK